MSKSLEVSEIIAKLAGFKVSEISDDSNLRDDLGMDSLDGVELVMLLEEKFDIEIPDENLEKFETAGDVIRYIEKKTGRE